MSGPPNNIVQLHRAKSALTKQRAEGKLLCESGFHKWHVVKESQFDVRVC